MHGAEYINKLQTDLQEKENQIEQLELEVLSLRHQNRVLESRLVDSATKLDWMKFDLDAKNQQIDDMSGTWK